MRQQIVDLRKAMQDKGIDIFYAPAGDPHGSEYVNDHYKNSEYLSGLLAENETLIVTQKSANIWTDGRFFLQADRELSGSGIELMKMGEEGVPTAMEFLVSLAEGFEKDHPDAECVVIGFDGECVPASLNRELKEAFKDHSKVQFAWDDDLADRYWKERPEIVPSTIWELPLSSAGKTSSEKIDEIRKAMADRDADYLILTNLMETAWLTNLRGADIAYTPVFFSYALMSQNEVILYVMEGALGSKEKALLEEAGIKVRKYESIFEDVSGIPSDAKVWIDLSSASYALYMRLNENNVINEMTPVALAKTVKNPVEIKSSINAHIKDGVAVTKFIRWIKDVAGKEPQTEISAADYLEARRREQDGCFDLSFGTISGYGPNGAIIHYAPSEETNLDIRPEGFLLVDSGGQYIDGTTDITRTIAVGPLTHEMIDGYTRVLKGHIALSRYVITPETTHKQLDECTRTALREVGLDYKHGVSHGVGHVLAVHEGPAGVRKTDTPAELKAGMIMSNEPGLYMAGEFGIRIENEILLKNAEGGCLVSEPITYVPYERAAIDPALLTDEELEWVNSYHAIVRDILLPHMQGEDAEFVIRETEPITR
ncbi:MAG: aminopeptidase P family protein [Mogibacterium sp.]|nr:aminopeptidase P family protein [Mogibacterium sp.]